MDWITALGIGHETPTALQDIPPSWYPVAPNSIGPLRTPPRRYPRRCLLLLGGMEYNR